MKRFLFFALEHDNTVSKERLKVSNYLLIIFLYTCLCTNIYRMFSQHYVSQVRNPFCSVLFSTQKPIVHCSLKWNAVPYIGKFDGQAAFGIYSLAATCGHNNTNQTLQPVALNINTAHTSYNAATAALPLWPVYGYGQSTVTANLQLQLIHGCGQSTVTAKL